MGNAVVHFEINSADAEGSGKFYSALFGWHTESQPELNYVTIDTHAGQGINGGLSKTEDPANVRFYVEVPDLDKALEVIGSLGGKTLSPSMEIPNIVTFAIFADPAGNVLGLVKSAPAQEGQGVSAGNNPPVNWFEAVGPDPNALKKFYGEAFDWSFRGGESGGITYFEADTGVKNAISGGIGSSPTGEARVTMYAQVDDLQSYLDKAAELGGKTVIEPTEMGQGTKIAIFLDPQGNAFGMYKTD